MRTTRHRRLLTWKLAVLLSGLAASGLRAQSTQPATTPSGPLIEGIVVNHLGAGIAGAAIRIEAVDAAEDAPPLGTGRTSATGDIRVQLDRPVSAVVRVRIKKEGFATFVQELDLSDETEQPWVDATLNGAATLTGIIRDRLLDEPIKGAKVICANGGQDFEAVTDGHGRYTFNTIAYGPATLTASARGFGIERLMIKVLADRAEADLQLGPERLVELRIITDEEKPAPDVFVEAVVQPGGEYITEKTGPDGRVALHGIGADADAVLLRLTGPRYIHMGDFEARVALHKPPAAPDAPTPASLPAVRQELIVHLAGSIRGKVIDAAGGEPIIGVRVIAGREFQPNAPMAWTTLDGTYELTGLPPGLNVVSYQHNSFATSIQEVHLNQEQTATLDVLLKPGQPISGTVVDAAGKPVEQVFISADEWEGYSTLGLRGITDKEGRFSFSNAPNGQIGFVFVKPGYGRPVQHVLTAGKTDHRIELSAQAPEPGEAASMGKIEVGKPVPDMTLVDINGTTYKLSELRGKYVFLDCWATWCGPCMGELPNVKALHEAMKERADFVLIGISLDTDRDELKRVTEAENMPWPQIFGPKSGAREAFESLSGVGIPFTCLIGPDGKLLAQELRGPQLTSQVKAIIAKQQASRPAP